MSPMKPLSRRNMLSLMPVGIAAAASVSCDAEKITLPSLMDTDVLVVGGGPAGLGAAIASAKYGVKTLLLERHGFFGGIASFGMGMSINQMRPGGKPRGGIHESLIGELLTYGEDAVLINGEIGGNFKTNNSGINCNVEYLKVAALNLLDQAGCHYLLHSRVVDTIVKKNRVRGVIVATKQGLKQIHANIVIDASGDADVAYFSGAATMKGRETDGFLSPMTLNFILTNINVNRVQAYVQDKKHEDLLKRAREKYPLLPQSFNLRPVPLENSVMVNHAGTKTFGILDGTDEHDMTIAESKSRRQIIQLVQALCEYGGDVFKNVQLAAAGPQVGVRETRRIKCEYVLTEEDAMTGRKFKDVVAKRSGYLDIGFTRMDHSMQVHDVPYRALVPEKIDGLLASGRCISATHVAASAGKSMGNCMATGHAAGVAAALSVRQRIQPRSLDVTEIQSKLTIDGVSLTK